MLRSPADIERKVAERGFLPFFAGEVTGFSIEEETPPEFWFPDNTIEGVWEWKGTIILEGDCAYGKFYRNKACFISMDFFPDFVNYRRSCYTLSPDEQLLLRTLQEHHSLLSKELKRLCGYVKPRQTRALNPLDKILQEETKATVRPQRSPDRTKGHREGFDTAITRLQMAGYVVTADFEYLYDHNGQRYGWGLARYCTPEDFFGPERLVCSRTPKDSADLLRAHLQKLLPQATTEQIARILG